jgi:drug/metabolite transporter (DMT)-like permease
MPFTACRSSPFPATPWPMTANQQAQHRLGLIMVAAAALCWSSAGLFVRGISLDLMTMLMIRGLFSGLAVFTLHCLLEGKFAVGDFRRMGWPGVGVALLSSMSMITGIGSIRFGAVADAMVIYATVPFVTAILAWLLIGERTTRSTIMASGMALLGVLVMLFGADWGGSMLGRGLACLMTLGMAGFSIIMRRHRDLPMLPAMAASGWLVSVICFWFADFASITPTQFLLCALFGFLQNAAGLAFYTLGTRRVGAAEATLLAALEVPFTPLWVWLFMNETPGVWTLAGGLVVLAALFTHIWGEFRRSGRTTESEFAPAP